MAALSDVEEGFVRFIANGLGVTSYTPYSVVTSPTINTDFRAYRGFPLDTQLNNDLKAGVSNISVFSSPELARNTTRFLRAMTPQIASQASATLTVSMTSTPGVQSVITFSGTATPSEVIGIGAVTSGYAYRVQPSDTPTSVAAAFAANMPHATSSGPVLTIVTPHEVSVAFSADFTMLTEVHRQIQTIRVSVWTPTTELRDLICATIDPAIMWQDRIIFPDNSISGPICAAGTFVDDVVGIEFMWRRDLLYDIEYATMYQQIVPPMVLGELIPQAHFI
jgi:hypothetical protein